MYREGTRWEHKTVRFYDATVKGDAFEERLQKFISTLSDWQIISVIRIESNNYRFFLTREAP